MPNTTTTYRTHQEILGILYEITSGKCMIDEVISIYGIPRSTIISWLRKYKADVRSFGQTPSEEL